MKILESHHQKLFVSWLNSQGLFYHSSMNENPLSKHVKNKSILMKNATDAKAMGSRKGYPDIVIYLPNKLLHIEFKLPTNKQSKEQIMCEKHISKFSYCKYVVCYSADEAINLVKLYLTAH